MPDVPLAPVLLDAVVLPDKVVPVVAGPAVATSDPSVPFSGAVPPQATNATHDDKTTPNIETR